MTTGEKLAKLRKAAGISVYRLARDIGVAQDTIARIESGRTDPSWSTIQRIAIAFNVTTDSLRPDDSEDTPKKSQESR